MLNDKILGPGGLYDPDSGSMILSADGNAILRQWKLQNPNEDLPSMDELINFAFERAQAEYQTVAKNDYEEPDEDEPDLGVFNNVNRYNDTYNSVQPIQGDHNVISRIEVGNKTGGINTTTNLISDVFIPGRQESLEELLGKEAGKQIGGEQFDVIKHFI